MTNDKAINPTGGEMSLSNCLGDFRQGLEREFCKIHKRWLDQCSMSQMLQRIDALQAENERLKNLLEAKCEYHVDYGSDTEALIDELKSENARLREDLGMFKELINRLHSCKIETAGENKGKE